jgi:hypothetical protein
MFISVIFGFSLVTDYRYIEESWKFYEFQNTVKLEGPSTDFWEDYNLKENEKRRDRQRNRKRNFASDTP